MGVDVKTTAEWSSVGPVDKGVGCLRTHRIIWCHLVSYSLRDPQPTNTFSPRLSFTLTHHSLVAGSPASPARRLASLACSLARTGLLVRE